LHKHSYVAALEFEAAPKFKSCCLFCRRRRCGRCIVCSMFAFCWWQLAMTLTIMTHLNLHISVSVSINYE